MLRFQTTCVLFLLALLCAGLAYSQTVNATLLGTVTDSTGGVIPNAKVTITEVTTNSARTGQTNDSGFYSFPNLPPGSYSVAVEAAGFKKELRRDITVLVDTNTRVDIGLQPGNLTETIEVWRAAAVADRHCLDVRADQQHAARERPPDQLEPQFPIPFEPRAGSCASSRAALAILQRLELAANGSQRPGAPDQQHHDRGYRR